MEALTERVERLETDEPGMRTIRWLTKKKVKEPLVERQTAEVKLIWDLQVKGVFNGERQAEMIRTFISTFEQAVEVMNMGGNETLMNALFMFKLGTVDEQGSRGDEQGSRGDEQGSRGDQQGSQRGNRGEWQGRSEFPKGRVITERRARIWSKTVQNRYLKGQCLRAETDTNGPRHALDQSLT
jgi:hypothetical protein